MSTETTHTEDTGNVLLETLTGLIRFLIEDRERCEQEMHKQMELLHRMVSENTAPARVARDSDSVKLTPLTDGDDIEAYLTTFERIMGTYDIAKECWLFKLAPQLTGKAQQVYTALPPEDCDEVKAAILRRYNINEETYHQRFRSLRIKEGEAPRELVTRLTDLAT